MKKQLTVTIGIPAHNEAKNIVTLIKSIEEQKEKSFIIKKIIIISDGSTDKTTEEVKKIHDKRITYIEGKTNKGRVYRRNQIINLAQSDVLVFLDADGFLENDYSLYELLLPFFNNESIGVVGGNPYSVAKSTNLLSLSLSRPQNIYTRIRYQIKNGNNVFGCMGGMMAIRRKLYKQIHIPSDIHADDTYIYFSCLEKNMQFINAKYAKVIHFFPQSISTYMKRRKRHRNSFTEITKYFDKKTVTEEFFMPRHLYYKESIKEFFRYPFSMIIMYALLFLGKHYK